jgi:uncharacterized protein (TIGR03437 family)
VPFPAFAADPLATPAPVFRIVENIVAPEITGVSAATLAAGPVAPGSIVSGFGLGFTATTFRSDAAPLPQLGPVTVDIIDLHGVRRPAPLYLAAPEQLNFVVSPDTVPGQAVMNVSSNGQSVATGTLRIARVAPGLFSATGDGKGIPAGFAVRPGQSALLARFNSATSTWIPEPVVIGDDTYLSLYGTGIRGRTALSDVQLRIGGESIPITFAGPHSQMVGVDQVNAGPLPASLRGRGNVSLELLVEGQSANALSIQIAP